jgi:hypothetical protein
MKKLFLLTTIMLFMISACAQKQAVKSDGFPNYGAIGQPTFSLEIFKKLF